LRRRPGGRIHKIPAQSPGNRIGGIQSQALQHLLQLHAVTVSETTGESTYNAGRM
jgi:hypothetical protein